MFWFVTKYRLAAIVSALVIVVTAVVFFPRLVSYTEISTRNLSVRSRSHREIPHLCIRVSTVKYANIENELSRYLTDTQQFLTDEKAETWLPVHAYKFGLRGGGHGKYIYDAVFQDEGLPRDIVNWCIKNPAEAQPFWRRVSKLLVENESGEAAVLIRDLVQSKGLRASDPSRTEAVPTKKTRPVQ